MNNLNFNITSKYKANNFFQLKPEVIYAMQSLTQQLTSLNSSMNPQGMDTEAQSQAVKTPNDDVGDQ